MRLTLIHNQSHATQDTYVGFNKSHVSLTMRCYNRDIQINYNQIHNHHKDTLMTTVQDTVHAQGRSTYDVYIEIDIDCQELLDANDIEYIRCKDDDTQNEVAFNLDREDYTSLIDQSILSMTNEQTLATALLNHELGEYVTKVTIFTPYGDKITFE